MEMFLQFRFQDLLDYRLSDPVSHCWYAQRSRPAIVLRYFDTAHCFRKVTTGRHPIPELEEVILQILLKFFNRLSVYSGSSTVSLHPFVRLPNKAFGNTERLCFTQKNPPHYWLFFLVKLDDAAPLLQFR